MQKKLIALAVASLVSAPVFAQSQVSVYGIVDQAIDSGNYGAGNVTRLTGSGYNTERLGFKGTEDLGNGMKANFVLELGQRTDTGMLDNANNQLFQRAATVGLSGGWGSVNFGRQYTPVFSVQGANDIFYVAGIGSLYSLTNIGQTRANNSIRYDSANFSGFTAAVMYALGDTNTAAVYQESTINPKDQGRHTGLNLRYANGPLALGLGWSNEKSKAVVAPASPIATKTTAVIGSYDFKVVAINAGWQTSRNDANPTTSDFRVWNIGAKMPVFGKDTVKLHYANLHNKLVTNTDSKLIALGYEHPMSKRTTLYGTWAKMTNESGIAGRSLFNAPAVGANTGDPAPVGYDPSSLQVGISHKF
jgi:predicted porin